MKCPNCNFVTSNSNDLCTRCGMDLRPRKRELGIAITNPLADIKELRAKLATQAKAAAEQAAAEKANQDKKIAEAPDTESERPKNERSWLSRLFGRAAATPTAVESKEAVSSAPSRPLSPFSANSAAKTKRPQSGSSPDSSAPAQNTASHASSQADGSGLEFPSVAASVTSAAAQSSDIELSSSAAQLGDKIGEEIQPDLSLNDFLSELERFQTSADDGSDSDQQASSDPFEVDPIPAAADLAEAEELDGFELPDFGLDDSHDLLAGLGIQTSPQPATEGPSLSASADEDDRPLFDTPPPNPLSASAADGLSTVEAHEMALDDLIGSMASNQAPAESDDPEEDALFSSLLRNVPDPGKQLDDLALSMEEHIEDAMAATADLADKALFAAELDQFGESEEESDEPFEENEDDFSDYRPNQEISEDAGLHDDDEYSMSSVEDVEEFDSPEDFDSIDSAEDSEEEASVQSTQQSSAPSGATPDVMEFDDDDQILEQQLDEMLGDLVLDVKAVKSAKPAAPKRHEEDDSDESIFVDDDLEISFEIEDEDGEYDEDDSEDSAETQTADSTQSDQILNQLVAAFNQIDSDTEHRSIVEAPADPLPLRPRIDLDTMLRRLREAAQTGSPNLIDELLNQVANGFGIDSHLLREAVNPAAGANEVGVSGDCDEDIEPVQTEPPAPVAAEKTFVAAVEPVRQLESGDDLESLGGELDRELAALMSEGTSIFSEAEGAVAAPALAQGEAIKAEPLEAQEISPQSVEADFTNQPSADDNTESDELGDLSSELDRELALLQAEGTSIIGQDGGAQSQAEAQIAMDSSETAVAEPTNEDDLSYLQSELDSEIAALEADGLTFHAEGPAEVIAEEAAPSQSSVEAAIDATPAPIEQDIASLEQALDSELAALLSEGTNFAAGESESPDEQRNSSENYAEETRVEESQICQPDAAAEDNSSEEPTQASELLESPSEVAAASDTEFAPTMTGAFLVSDLTALEQTLDQELAALTAEGMTFAGGEAQTEPEEAAAAAAADRESTVPEADQMLGDGAETHSDQAEIQATIEEDHEGFAPTMTGAFLASDFAALLSTSPEKARTEEAEAEIESETVQLDNLPEEPQAAAGESNDISDLEAELDQELALLQAEGFGLSKEDEQTENLQAMAGESEPEQLSTDSENEIDLGDLEAIEANAVDEEVELGSLEDLTVAAEDKIAEDEEGEDVELINDELPAAISTEENESSPPQLHSEAENSATATGVFLAADLEAILNSYKVPPRLSDEPLPEEATPSKESSVVEKPAQIDLVSDSIESIGQESAVESLQTKEPILESSIVGDISIETAALDPADQIPATDDEVLEVEIEEIEEEETSAAAPARIPFNPEEVSIEAEDEPAMNFSGEGQENSRQEFSQEEPGEIKVDAPAQTSSEQSSELNGHQAPSETEHNLTELAPVGSDTDLDDQVEDEIDQDDDDDFPSMGLGEIPAVLWMRALEDPELDSLEMEIEGVELCEVGPSPKVTMLFDLAEEELAAPVQLKAYVEAIPTSVNRELVDAGLKRAVKRYEKEVHQELTRPRDSADSSDSIDVNVSIEALFSVHSPAALWRRAAALTFDLTVSAIIAVTAVWFLLLDSSVKDLISSGSVPQMAEILPGLAAVAGISWLIWTIFNVLPTSESGQTGGQRMFGIAVFDLEGNTPGFGQIFVRTMLEITTLLTGGLGILTAFGKHRRMLHDRLACTVVVQINS